MSGRKPLSQEAYDAGSTTKHAMEVMLEHGAEDTSTESETWFSRHRPKDMVLYFEVLRRP